MAKKLKLGNRDSIWFHENSGKVNVEYAKNVCDVAILPIGAIEQHGPHCPCGSDTFNAIGIAEKVAEKSGAMLLPSPMYGSHPYMHWGMEGTIPLKYETHIALLEDIIRGAAVAGYNKFIIISAHGQVSSTIVAVHKLGLEGYFTLASTWYDFLRDNKNVLEDYMWHADEAETSLALHLYPELVDMDLAVEGGGTPLLDSKWKIAPGEGTAPGSMYHFEGTFALLEKDDLDEGVIGNPKKATAEKGEKLVSAAVNYYAELIEEIKEKYKCGVNPLGFRNPASYAGTNNIQYDNDHDEKGRLKK
ncbi:creatininase family protein [Maledivibacter halophilus]|uniref:Creatinine amidohydrolase n=1 Tax=Maledivibacter halophilus TaxID=36842 RepID=A0A1T5IAL5_9FIRM|nr:creatininase family protein [Maledivibacter halophilus]SKC36209.1 creatinine amidohydrolase [Maledivibacter halophilus]